MSLDKKISRRKFMGSAAAVGAVTAWLPAIVMGETFASSSASSGTTTGTVFLRMM